MGTSSSAGQSREDHGIIPRVLYQLFEMMKANEKTHTYMLNIQFIEIYNGHNTHTAPEAGVLALSAGSHWLAACACLCVLSLACSASSR